MIKKKPKGYDYDCYQKVQDYMRGNKSVTHNTELFTKR